jgi:nucleoid DNA-binding protein
MIEQQAYVNALKDSMPHKFDSDADAQKAVDVVFSVISKAVKNRDAVELPGVGEIRSEPEGDHKRIVFTPAPVLKQAADE